MFVVRDNLVKFIDTNLFSLLMSNYKDDNYTKQQTFSFIHSNKYKDDNIKNKITYLFIHFHQQYY